jgi:hypothetical protein
MMALLQQTIALEEPHKEQLERLAIQIVAKVWKAKPELFEAEIGETGPPPEEEPEEEEELTPEQIREINKRITLNTIIHGASIHQMTTMHHLAKEAIDRIDPQLIPFYDKLSRTMNYSGWFMNLDMLMTQLGQKGGQNEIVWDEDTPKIQAKGIIFPILVHELSKGCVELITHHGLPKDPDMLKVVLKHADKDLEEMFHFFMGPELWRRFLKLVDMEQIPEIVMALSKLEPDKLHEIMSLIASSMKEDPTNVKKMIADLVQEPEEFEVKDWEPEEPGSEEGKGEFEDIQKIADSISEDVPAPSAPTKPAHMPTKPGTPEKPDPYRPPKPAFQPKPKAGAAPSAPTKPAPTPTKPGTPEKPDPYRPPKPAFQPKPKATHVMQGVDECTFESKLDMAITEAFETYKVTIDCHPRRSDPSQCKHPECPTRVAIGEYMPKAEAILMARDYYDHGSKMEPEGTPAVPAYHGTHPEDIPAELELAGGPVDLPPPEEELGAGGVF